MSRKSTQIAICVAMLLFAGCPASPRKSSLQPTTSPRLSSYASGICLDNSTGLMWLVDVSDEEFETWGRASQYADNLVAEGFEDWRLPTYDELYILRRIMDRRDSGDCRIKLTGSLWTGSTEKEARAGFWDSEPLCGGPSYYFVKSSRGSVIAVRVSKVPP